MTVLPDRNAGPETTSVSTDFLALTERPVIKRRNIGQIIGVIVVLYVLVLVAITAVPNPGFGWPTVVPRPTMLPLATRWRWCWVALADCCLP